MKKRKEELVNENVEIEAKHLTPALIEKLGIAALIGIAGMTSITMILGFSIVIKVWFF